MGKEFRPDEIRATVKLWLETDEGYVFGEGAFELLDRIDRFGTISDAASSIKMSYRRAWGILKKIERRLGAPILETRRGGRNKGGSRLTKLGRSVLKEYSIKREAIKTAQREEWGWEDLSRKISERNKLDGEVVSIRADDVASVVKIRVSVPSTITATITREAVNEMNLRKGTKIQAIIKVRSVMIRKPE